MMRVNMLAQLPQKVIEANAVAADYNQVCRLQVTA